MKKKQDNRYISVYLRNHEEGPSCYYRVMQYIRRIKEYDYKINDALSLKQFRRNMDINNGMIKKIYQLFLYFIILLNRSKQLMCDLKNEPKVIIVQREIFPKHMPLGFKYLYKRLCNKSKVIWDFDDSILESGEISKREWNILSNMAYKIFATSDYLLDKCNASVDKKVRVYTSDEFCDEEMFQKQLFIRKEEYKHRVRLCWVGTQSNLNYIVGIVGLLRKAGDELSKIGKKLELSIVCNVAHSVFFENNDSLNICFKKWTREEAENTILDSHIGLMPLPDTEFSRGKGGFKLIQYISSGIPVIASDVGMNKEIVKKNIGKLVSNNFDWREAVIEYSSNIELWEESCINARNRYKEKYSYEDNLMKWKLAINDCINLEG